MSYATNLHSIDRRILQTKIEQKLLKNDIRYFKQKKSKLLIEIVTEKTFIQKFVINLK